MKVYGASKLRHAPLWRDLKEIWKGRIEIVSRWPWAHVGKVPDTPEFASQFWLEDEEDVRKSDLVLILQEEEDVLRGALVEAGMAIALGKPVIVVGENPSYGTWQYHPSVYRVPHLVAAFNLIMEWQDAPRSQP